MRPTCPILCTQCPCVFVTRLAPIGNTVILGIEKGYIDTRVGLSLPYLTSYFKQYAHATRTVVGSGDRLTMFTLIRVVIGVWTRIPMSEQ